MITDLMPSLKQVQRVGLNTDMQVLHAEIYKAEVALKQSKTRDYYKIICVVHNASKANMRTVRQHKRLLHYLSKGGNKKTLKPMAKVYVVLSDPQCRRLHDFWQGQGSPEQHGWQQQGQHHQQDPLATCQGAICHIPSVSQTQARSQPTATLTGFLYRQWACRHTRAWCLD
jgi:DnaJ family protein C protein 7